MREKLMPLLLACVLVPAQAQAGAATGGATEVTQILNNIELLMQSAEMENQTATALQKYATQLEQYQIQQRQTAPADNHLLSEHQQDILAAREVVDALAHASRDFHRGLERLRNLGQSAQHEWAAGDMSWEDYLSRRAHRHEESFGRREVLSAEEQHVIQHVSEQGQRVQQYANAIPRSQGSHEALQLMNGQINMLVSTLQEQLRFSARMSEVESEERLDEIERDRDAAHAAREYWRAQAESDRKSEEAILRLINGGQE